MIYAFNDRFITTQNGVSRSVTALLQLSIKLNTVAVSVPWLDVHMVRCPPVLNNKPVQVLRLPVYVSGTLLWINPSSVGHGLGLGYILSCTLPESHLSFCYAKCPCMELSNHRGTIPKGQEVFSLYISGRCLQKP